MKPIMLRAASARSRLVLPLLVLLAAGCGTPAPPPRLVHLPSAPPAAVTAPVAAAARPAAWQLVLPVRIPDYLDRDVLLLPQGDAGLAPLPGWRWAEPLRESVPRVLRADLAALGVAAWVSPLPPGLVLQRQLRVELLGFEAAAGGRSVRLQARWTLADPSGATPPLARSATLVAELDGSGGDALAAAHRVALWRLAERIVQP